jgi:hypothetical protein
MDPAATCNGIERGQRLGRRCRFLKSPFVVESEPTKGATVQYILLIYGNETAQNDMMATMSEEEQAAEMGRWFAYTDDLKKAGVYVAGEALHDSSTASSVTLQDGQRLVTDGPFAETKEQLGGFYIIDTATEDEAHEWAAKIPSAQYGAVTEVRQVMVFDEVPA